MTRRSPALPGGQERPHVADLLPAVGNLGKHDAVGNIGKHDAIGNLGKHDAIGNIGRQVEGRAAVGELERAFCTILVQKRADF